MMDHEFLEELLDKYDLDQLLDIFIGMGLTPREFCDRFVDYIHQMKEDEIER